MKDQKIEKLKTDIAVVETADKNIEHYNKLKDRELCIIPTDSEYYKEFKEWKNAKGSCYDGEKELQPTYATGKQANDIIDLLIDKQVQFSKPFRDKLLSILAD